jgi:CBS domain-containing protein
MRVKAIMTTPVVTVKSTTPLSEAIFLMGSGGLSGLAVVDDLGQLCGILSEGDLLRRVELGTTAKHDHWWSSIFERKSPAEIYNHANGRRVGDVMTTQPITIDGDDSLADAARLMELHHVKRLPVLSEGSLVGMLSRSDFIDVLRQFIAPVYEEPATSDNEIRTRILAEIASQPWSVNCGIKVSVRDGRVTLSGVVPTEDHRASARIAAENVIGVVSVHERLTVVETLPAFGM